MFSHSLKILFLIDLPDLIHNISLSNNDLPYYLLSTHIKSSPADSAVSIIPAKNRNVNFQIKNRTNVLAKQKLCVILSISTNIRFLRRVSLVDRIYICIDLKSFYASVECVSRGLDPLKARLLVADESRSDQTICLAVFPPLKAIGVPSRPRLFEAKQAIKVWNTAPNMTARCALISTDGCTRSTQSGSCALQIGRTFLTIWKPRCCRRSTAGQTTVCCTAG